MNISYKMYDSTFALYVIPDRSADRLLRYPMKLVPLATLVHMDVKAFPSRPSVPLLITNSIVYHRSSVLLLITNSKKEFDIMTAMEYIASSPELLWSFICSGHRDKSCSDHFVPNVASVSIEFASDCSCIVQCTYFIYDSITLTSSEFDVSSDGPLS
ncbi:hypothetical protein T01_1282 [Trichinella spiralis]|uniref:Uncharacterized protein n=1 Tax=Trichinella spiralis TaxID=6334 RepID=A0A0V1B8H6_TRISP|nr:hypothetical protein T01_1282 [Trichinella spiralis]